MITVHQRHFLESDRMTYAAIGNSLALGGMSSVRLDKGGAHAQKISNRCAAAACWNALETCDEQWDNFPDVSLPSPQEIYLAARSIDDFAEHEPGTSLTAAAEAACRIIGHGIRWMSLPLDPQILAAWLATERTGIAFGTVWTAGHMTPRQNVLVPTAGESTGAGHAIHLFGFDRAHAYRPKWYSPARKRIPVFLVENSHTHPEREFYLPADGVQRHGLSAVVFIPPNY